jgi:hypothetical protein
VSAEATGTGREALTLALFRCRELRAALAFGVPQEAWEDCRQGIAATIEDSDWLAAVVAEAKAAALREAADTLDDHNDCDCEDGDHLTRLATSVWLRARADRAGGA